MIDYNCHKCGGGMSSPDSMAGQADQCGTCGASCIVPQPMAVRLFSHGRRYSILGVHHARQFIKRRKKLVGIVAVNLVMLTSVGAWLLPSWLPRPVLTIQTPAQRESPPPEAAAAPVPAGAREDRPDDELGVGVAKVSFKISPKAQWRAFDALICKNLTTGRIVSASVVVNDLDGRMTMKGPLSENLKPMGRWDLKIEGEGQNREGWFWYGELITEGEFVLRQAQVKR